MAHHPSLPQDVSQDEAIVVLTGDQHRIPKALELLRHRGSPLLVISGTGRNTTLRDLVNQQEDAAVGIHQVWKKIIVESRSGSTIENAEDAGSILLEHKVHRVILATSEYHMLRALRIFDWFFPGWNIVPYPVASSVSEISLLPTRTTVDAFFKIWWEYWKYSFFRIYAAHQLNPIQK